MSVQSTIESLLKLKPISREFAESLARKMGMDCDPATGVVTGPQILELGDKSTETRVGEYVVLCFEFNFMDERRERLAEAKAAAAKKAESPTTEGLYCLYLGAFMSSIQGRVISCDMTNIPTANLWAISAGLRDGVAFREGRVDTDDDFNTYEDFVTNLKDAVGGVQFAPQ